jgi:peptidyl-prolyl cis-trans isomerase A (cyclophilin A)
MGLFFLVGIGCSAMAGSQQASVSPNRPVKSGQQDQEPAVEIPLPAKATEKAPETFRVKFETTKGDFVLDVTRKWSPNGADRFYNLVKLGYFKDIAVFRAIKGFMFQFGIHGDPKVNEAWSDANIKDDPKAGQSNTEGMISYAMGGPNTRSVQFFVNLGNNARLDDSGFTPFGKVVEGMDVVKQINTEYGENSREVQGNFEAKGNAFILEKYPNLDMIKSVTIVEQQ